MFEHERELISIALNSDCAFAIDTDLRGEQWFNPEYGHLWDTIRNGAPSDDALAVCLSSRSKTLDDHGILDLTLPLPNASLATFLVEQTRASFANRRMDALFDELKARDKTSTPPSEVAEHAMRALEEIAASATPTAYTGCSAALGYSPTPHIDLGLGRALDAIAPIAEGELLVLAARPGSGKTALAQAIALRSARTGRRVLYVTLEMSPLELTLRSIAADLGVPYLELRQNPRHVAAIRQRAAEDRTPITYDATRKRTIGEIRASVRAHKPDLLVVDYLGLIAREQRTSEIDHYSRSVEAINALAEAHKVPTILLSQINRAGVQRDRNGIVQPPQLNDLVGSAVIEATADMVLLLHRHSCYYPGERDGEIDLFLAKGRHGGTGVATLRFDAKRLTYREA